MKVVWYKWSQQIPSYPHHEANFAESKDLAFLYAWNISEWEQWPAHCKTHFRFHVHVDVKKMRKGNVTERNCVSDVEERNREILCKNLHRNRGNHVHEQKITLHALAECLDRHKLILQHTWYAFYPRGHSLRIYTPVSPKMAWVRKIYLGLWCGDF